MEANLLILNREFRLAFVDEFVERKRTQGEHATLSDGDQGRFDRDRERLNGELLDASADSELPDEASAFDALHEFVVRLRLVN